METLSAQYHRLTNRWENVPLILYVVGSVAALALFFFLPVNKPYILFENLGLMILSIALFTVFVGCFVAIIVTEIVLCRRVDEFLNSKSIGELQELMDDSSIQGRDALSVLDALRAKKRQ